jgi:hypothetical protein
MGRHPETDATLDRESRTLLRGAAFAFAGAGLFAAAAVWLA